MTGMVYTASFPATAVAAPLDFFEILAGSLVAVEILEVHIGQSTEEGDTEAEMLEYELIYGDGSVTSGSGGSAATIGKSHQQLPSPASTVEVLNTTKMAAGTGTLEPWIGDAFHVAAGMHYVPTPEDRPWISPGDRFTIELVDTPNDSITFRGYMKFAEYGG